MEYDAIKASILINQETYGVLHKSQVIIEH
jgi:hypothetical protein